MGYVVTPYRVDFAKLSKLAKPGQDARALEKHCQWVGKVLANDAWSALHGDWFDTVDAELDRAGAGVALSRYFRAGAPVEIVPPEDFPVVGRVEPKEIAELQRRLKAFVAQAAAKAPFVLPESFPEGFYAFTRGKFRSWCLEWTGTQLEERAGTEKPTRHAFATREEAQVAARELFQRQLAEGFQPVEHSLRRFRNERVRSLRLGTYQFTRGAERWAVRITAITVNETVDGKDRPPRIVEGQADALRLGAELIKQHLADGFVPAPHTVDSLPDFDAAPSAEPEPASQAVVEAVSQFVEWLAEARSKKSGLVFFYQ